MIAGFQFTNVHPELGTSSIGVSSGVGCPSQAGIHLGLGMTRNCEQRVPIGLLVEAGDGYRAQPNMDVPKYRNTREGTAALPYAEISECGTDKFNEI